MIIALVIIAYIIGAITSWHLIMRQHDLAFPELPHDNVDYICCTVEAVVWPAGLPLCYLMFRPHCP